MGFGLAFPPCNRTNHHGPRQRENRARRTADGRRRRTSQPHEERAPQPSLSQVPGSWARLAWKRGEALGILGILGRGVEQATDAISPSVRGATREKDKIGLLRGGVNAFRRAGNTRELRRLLTC